ncbi:hypothetical protein B0T14DRAFT_524742 [Immersiella caudata]|uniref:Uncharacterized protein n=1 Tax=Immersiella caudata TaxID=314043 RepID=A0AA40BXI7_9PEZI|nr:hypothetical protein B0T14DRAFT_524742 [Immersiella caudata]
MRARLVVGSVMISKSLVLYVFASFFALSLRPENSKLIYHIYHTKIRSEIACRIHGRLNLYSFVGFFYCLRPPGRLAQGRGHGTLHHRGRTSHRLLRESYATKTSQFKI